jgi:hypothetical protein
MKYQKPEIQVVVSALDAVQAMDKQPRPLPDNTEILKTVSAYQADE